MKKFIICWLFFLIPMVSSAYDFEKDGFYYSVISKEDKTCQIYGGTNDHKEGDLVIPATVTHNDTTFSVIAISGFGRYSSKSGYIKSVIIPEGVKIIKKNAFEFQTQLNFVSLPNSVERIEQSAFGRCPLSKMRKLIMPKNLKYLGYNAFCEEIYAINESIVTIVIQEKLDSIDAFAFSAMHNLQKVVFLTNKAPTSFDSSGRTYGPFYDCGTPILYSCWSDGNWKGLAGEKYEYISNYFEEDGITYIPTSISPMTCDVIDCDYSSNISTSINIPSEVTHSGVTFKVNNIRRYAFKSNEYIKEVICNNNGSIDESAFADCSSLVNITFGDNVTSIGSNILEDCTNISKVVLGQSINTIPNKAFANCESLTEVTYNGNVKALGQSAFENCYNLYRFNFPDNLEIINHSTFLNCKKLEKIVIPNTVTRIESLAFSGCESIEDVDIPSSVTSLGNSIFEGCTGLKTVKVGDGLTSLNAIFKGCTSLNEIVIGNNIKTIEESAFEDLTSLGTLVIPNHVEKIGNKAFKGCVSLKNLTFEKSETTLLLGYNKSDIFEIGQSTFSDCPLETVYLGRNLSYESSSNYGYSPFYGISTLKDVSFDNSIVVLSENLFYNCNNLTTVKIPDSVTNIENSVFNGCSGLTSVIFLNPSPVAITEQVFSNRANATLYVPAGSKAAYEAADYWKEFKEIVEQINNNITFADSNVKAICVNHWDTNGDGEISLDEAAAVTTLSDFFKNNTSITSFDELVYFTGLTSIGDQAFYFCNSLNSVIIPNSVTSIGNFAFWGCSGLISFTIPNSVTSIGNDAFEYCSGLTSVNIPSSVTSIGDYVFTGCSNLTSVTVLNSIPAAITGQVFSNRANATLYVPYGSKDAYETADNWKEFKNIVELADGNITFADSNVKAICVEHWDADHDGEISFVEAALVKDLSEYFFRNTSITSFDELAYFIGLTSIGDYAFSSCSGLTSITIPNSVTSIGYFAFYGCSGLTSFTIPNSVTSIGLQALDGCSSLTTITIPKSVTNIGVNLFNGCSGLTSIVVESENPKYDSRDNCNAIIETETNKLIIGCGKTIIPNSVTSIQGYAFYGCSGLASITIPNSVTSIGRSAFYKDSGLEKVIVNDIASWCNISFEDPSSNPLYFAHHLYSDDNTEITDLVIPSGVTNIGSNAFSGCNVLTSITIPNSVTSIGGRVFLNCSGLTSITIPNSVTSIGEYAFAGCSDLTSITIPASVTNIGEAAFASCSGLTSVTVLNPSPIAITEYVFPYRANATLYVPAAVKAAYEAADYWKDFHVEKLSDSYNITFDDDNVKAICVEHWDTNGDGEISLDEAAAVATLSDYFKNNTSITSFDELVYFTGLTSIGDQAFGYCSSLTSITIPNSVTSIGDNAFSGCSGLTSIVVESGNTKYDSRENCNAIIETTTNNLIWGCKNTIIPNSVMSIGDQAFGGCYGLSSITIPNSVMSIGNGAFSGCSGLTTIVVESDNTVYDSRDNCNAIINTSTNTLVVGCKNTIIPNSVTSIGIGAFAGCRGLSSITIPSSVTSIGEYAFQSCLGLTSITIPNSVTSIGDYAFNACLGLNSITIPNGVTSIGRSVFYNCRELTSITIPNSVTSIGDYAFDGCFKLTSITIPNSVTSIGRQAFYNCRLTSVTVLNPSPVALTQYVFSNRANATLYVPAGSKAAYEAADYWNEFKEIISNYILGDANDDGFVNVSDIVEMVNYIMNNASSRFLKEAADMNEDGEVNVTDIVSVVAVIMSDGHANSRAAIVDEDTSSDYLTLNESSDNLLSLALHNQANYVASQFVVSLSDGLTLENISLNDKRGGNHVLVYSKESDNQYRVLIYSLNNSSFNGNDGELLSIKTSGKGNVSIDDIIFVTSGIKTRNFSSIGYGEGTTGIEKVETSETMDIYSIDGRLIRRQATNTNGLSKGIYIVNGKKCVVK